jgi:hypothetical protein
VKVDRVVEIDGSQQSEDVSLDEAHQNLEQADEDYKEEANRTDADTERATIQAVDDKAPENLHQDVTSEDCDEQTKAKTEWSDQEAD